MSPLPMMWKLVLLLMGPLVKAETEDEALSYLTKFGYLDNQTIALPPGAQASPESGRQVSLEEAVRVLQEFAGLNVTGELDPRTLELIRGPRCGVRDISSRYQLQGSQWDKGRLTYRVTKYSKRMSRSQVNNEVWRAFSYWSAVTNLQFVEITTGDVDINIRFESFGHGDGDAFDGAGGTLAHAFFPRYGGDVHMDESEAWTVGTYSGTNFLQTLTHEIGHSLGLEHSRVSGAVMAPFYRGWDPAFKLHTDDIRGVQALYGTKVSSTTPGTGIFFPTDRPVTRPPIFPTERPPIPAFKCPEISTNTQGREVVARIDGITSWAACSVKCSDNKSCRFWTWHHEDAGPFAFRCVLMADTLTKVIDENAVSGTKHCVCPMIGINLQGREGVVQAGRVSTWSACAAKCRSTGDCNHWTWHPPTSQSEYSLRCVLMAAFSNTAEDRGAVSGSRNC